jgi:hypothetical protein
MGPPVWQLRGAVSVTVFKLPLQTAVSERTKFRDVD